MLAGLLCAGEGQSGPRPKAPPATTKVKVQEATALGQAYVVMAGADHSYDGHRAHSMEWIHKTIVRLDQQLKKAGHHGVKIAATQQEIAAARIKFIAEHQATVHEAQALSDAQMRESLLLLVEVRKTAAEHNQTKIRDHVGSAIREIEVALKIR